MRPTEIIVVDDGSTDRTQAIIRDLGADIRYFYQDNRGEAGARNRGIALAVGEAIAFLDADDAWPPNRLATLSARRISSDARQHYSLIRGPTPHCYRMRLTLCSIDFEPVTRGAPKCVVENYGPQMRSMRHRRVASPRGSQASCVAAQSGVLD
jgi:glycosyltransferase involved in cell wall biosynthesis